MFLNCECKNIKIGRVKKTKNKNNNIRDKRRNQRLALLPSAPWPINGRWPFGWQGLRNPPTCSCAINSLLVHVRVPVLLKWWILGKQQAGRHLCKNDKVCECVCVCLRVCGCVPAWRGIRACGWVKHTFLSRQKTADTVIYTTPVLCALL